MYRIQKRYIMAAEQLAQAGSGIYEVLTRNSAVIQGKLGDRIEVKYVLDLREFPGDPVQDVLQLQE